MSNNTAHDLVSADDLSQVAGDVFTDPGGENMALFRSWVAAEAFATSEPFFLEGAVREYQIKEWGDTMLSSLARSLEIGSGNGLGRHTSSGGEWVE